jgi:DNA-binding TFAR19-related protein (PDSD5 family)
MWYSNRFKLIEAQNQNQNYEYFSKFPDFNPSDPDSFKLGYLSDTKTVKQLTADITKEPYIVQQEVKDYSSQKKFAEGLYNQLLPQSGTPFAAVQKALEAVFYKFDYTFTNRDKIFGLNDIKNHLTQLATNETREINKNLQQENILRHQLYIQGLEVIKNLKDRGMTNEEIVSQMSSKLNNLFKQGQISQKVNSELYNFFVMKINS